MARQVRAAAAIWAAVAPGLAVSAAHTAAVGPSAAGPGDAPAGWGGGASGPLCAAPDCAFLFGFAVIVMAPFLVPGHFVPGGFLLRVGATIALPRGQGKSRPFRLGYAVRLGWPGLGRRQRAGEGSRGLP
jgi:hypothetical protein